MSATVKPGSKQTEVGVIPERGLMYQSGRWVRLPKGKATLWFTLVHLRSLPLMFRFHSSPQNEASLRRGFLLFGQS